ncbi:zinc ribbon domain-containing protein [Bacillus timonensis]|uniref:zinc ribbon domain-containing protein n=1 Tax=Bacillus timonensis TaxID=1033734 RepID=UPI0002DFEB3E|nr:zinc ribbon domain-containing protein [Bacillus timonensis]
MQNYKVIDLSCPSCGGSVSSDMKNCKYCGNPVTITTFADVMQFNPLSSSKYLSSYENTLKENPNDFQVNVSAGICHLKLSNYDLAQKYFEQALIDNPYHTDTYFYSAVCKLQGKKAFLTPKKRVDEAIQLINTAQSIEQRGIAFYFGAYLKYDFYFRKALNIQPSYDVDLMNAREQNVTEEDKRILFDLLKVQQPSVLH